MKLKAVSNLSGKIVSNISRASFKARKTSPELFIIGGVVASVAALVQVGRATAKVNTIKEETKKNLEKIDNVLAHPEDYSESYTSPEEAEADRRLITWQGRFAYAKLYLPAIGMEAISITCFLMSHRILKKRNLALGAAYAAVDKAFKDYRNRVADRFGSEVEKQIQYGIKQDTIEKKVYNKKGKEKTITEDVEIVENPVDSPYVKYFTRTNPLWTDDRDFLQFTFRQIQNEANDKLRVHGYVILNDVYEALGFQKTRAGMVCGWFKNNPEGKGDNFVEFDVRRIKIPNERGVLETAYAIDFNCEGDIYKFMK